MPNRMKRRSMLTGLATVWGGDRARALAAEPAGAVETARGECYARTAAERRMLAPAASVFVGDAVGTGVQSALSMHLGAATQVKLGAEAQLRIDRFVVSAGGVLVLDRGAMLYDHDTSAGRSDVTVRGPYGLVAVRGTRFFAGPSNGVFGVFVERGTVTVVGVSTSVTLFAGQGTNIARPADEPTLPTRWAAPRIASAMASVN
jgi:hypothetical protein